MTALRHVAQVVNRRLEMQSLLTEVVRQVGEELGYPVVEISLVEGDQLVLRAACGSEEAMPFQLSITQGVTGRAVRRSEAIYVPDVRMDPDYVSGGTEANCGRFSQRAAGSGIQGRSSVFPEEMWVVFLL